MQYSTEKQKGGVVFTFTVPKAEWEEEINAAYLRTRGKYAIPGFRRGKATRHMIEQAYGPMVFIDDAFNSCAQKSYLQAMRENPDIVPVSDPELKLSDSTDDAVVFTISVTVKPDVTLGEYKGLTVPKSVYEVTDKDVEAEIQSSLMAKSRLVDVTDRAAADGDTVTIDYSGSIDGVAFAGGTAQGQELTLGSHSFIPGFEEQVVGMKIDESKDLPVKFPEDYHAEELKGKDAVFAVTLHAIKTREVPVLDETFVKDTTAFETVEEYRNDVRKHLQDNAARRADTENENKMLEAVVATATVEIPDCMVEQELDYIVQEFEYRLSYMYGGMKLDDYLKYTGSSREELRKDRREEAKKAVKTRLVIEAIIKAEKIEVTDADVDARIAELAAAANKPVEEYAKTVDEHYRSHLRNDITVQKVLDLLKGATHFEVKATEKKPAAKKTAEKKPAAEKADAEKKPAAKKTTKKAE